MNGLNISFFLTTLFFLISEMNIFAYANRYVGYPEGNGVQGGFGMVSSLSRRRPNSLQGYYPFAKRSVVEEKIASVSSTDKEVKKPNIIWVSESDLKCATLEACLGGTDASQAHIRSDEIIDGNTLESIDYLLMPAFRHGYFSKSRAYCRQIYSDCKENANL